MVIDSPSLVQWCADVIATAIADLGWSCGMSISLPGFKMDRQRVGILASPLPRWLATHHKAPLETIGTLLIQHIQQRNYPVAPKIWLHDNGWLYLQFSDVALAHWLQQGLTLPPTVENGDRTLERGVVDGISANSDVFSLQYAHARCCSLLRLAAETLEISIAREISIPWLNAAPQLHFVYPSEMALTRLILQFPHGLGLQKQILGFPGCPFPGVRSEIPESVSAQQLQTISETFLQFYQACRLWGTVSPPELRLARWGLVQLTQSILQFSLQQWLNHAAPQHL
jgi:hypothetical protein